MSQQSSSYQSYASYSSASYSSTSGTGSGEPVTRSERYAQTETYNDRDGHTVTRTHQKDGGPIYQDTTSVPADRTLQSGDTQQQGRIEDVSSSSDDQEARDRQYEEAMEDEYAKREGGA